MVPPPPVNPSPAHPHTGPVTIIGDNGHVVPTVGFFVGGGVPVRVYTARPDIEHHLAPYPGVHVTLMTPGYAAIPADLPASPYFLAVESDDDALRIRAWLPPTVAVFLLGSEHRRRALASGFLSLTTSPSALRHEVHARLATLRRLDDLIALARPAEKPLILLYGDPDPDAIGAGLGLAAIWRTVGREARIRYTGEVKRYQNRLLLSYLKDADIDELRDSELAEADLVAVVDAQPGFWKTAPPAAHVIIDHHPHRPDSIGAFVQIRSDVGATSTLVAEYLIEADLPIPKALATALLYGLETDTDHLNRHTSAADIRVFEALHPRADHHFLDRLDKSQIPMPVLDWIGWGISHRVVVRDMMLIHFGTVPTPDVMVQVADLMLLTCGIWWVVCAGVHDGKLIAIFRGDGHHQDVGKRAAQAFSKIGSAGGHRTMGRAEVDLGEHGTVESSVEVLVKNLFRRMSYSRRRRLINVLLGHLQSGGPQDHEQFEFIKT
jgi:nanoRNase/pAp phosphatase (c-di-AMP/oligoRNAs hydrolase)